MIEDFTEFRKFLDREEGEFIVDAIYSNFKLIFVDEIDPDEDILGLTDFDYHQIKIKKKLPSNVRREVLIHEITHLIAEIIGLGGHPSDHSEFTELSISNEELVTRMSRGMLMFLRFNPSFKLLF